jgi:RecB family exonuclease
VIWPTDLQTFRQSLLSSFDACPLMTSFELQAYDEWDTGPQARGTVFHAVAAEVVRTLARTGEEQIPTQEAVEIMYEILARPDSPHVPKQERETLRRCVLGFATLYKFSPRVVAIEERLGADVLCQDGKTRRLTGQIDLLTAMPPIGAMVTDYKSSWGPPKSARGVKVDAPDHPEGKQYLSARGMFQLDVYGFLVMRNYPDREYVTLREAYPLDGAFRQATLGRADLEHVERELAIHLQALDEMIQAGPSDRRWRPQPGRHCAYCPRPSHCPIDVESRVRASGSNGGGIASDEEAERFAGYFVVADTVRDTARAALKARHEETGRPIPVRSGKGRYMMGWQGEKPNRKFGIYPVPEAMGVDGGGDDA